MAKTDWNAIKSEYLAGIVSIRKIGILYGISETAIRKKARSGGWVRNPASAKAKRVAEKLATDIKNAEGVAKTIIDDAVDQDVADMMLGLDVAREILRKVQERVRLEPDDRGLKVLSETLRLNIDTIRKIRGLDEKDDSPEDLSNYSEEQLLAELERLQS